MEEFGMARQSKRKYLRSIYKRYCSGRRSAQTAMFACQSLGSRGVFVVAALQGTTRPGSLLKQMIPIKTDHRRYFSADSVGGKAACLNVGVL
jgi:hypothetical protein